MVAPVRLDLHCSSGLDVLRQRHVAFCWGGSNCKRLITGDWIAGCATKKVQLQIAGWQVVALCFWKVQLHIARPFTLGSQVVAPCL